MSILFKEDWAKYPTAIVDSKTTNISFLRQAVLYRKMGIENYTFLLALHNPLLQGVNPHAENLTTEYKVMIAVEIAENAWYYFREVLRVPPPAGDNPIPLKANRANIAAIWCALNHITSYLIQPRQTGKTLIGTSIKAYMANTAALNTKIFILTKDDKLRTKTAEDIKELINLLPPYLRMMNKKDIKNTEKITVNALGNKITIAVAQQNSKSALNVGRGLTNSIVLCDEFAYLYNLILSLPVLLSSTTAAREIAEEAGEHYYTMFSTTPGKLNTADGKFAYKIYNESLRWSEKFLDSKDLKEVNSILDKNSKLFKVMLLEFNHRQLGFTDAWLRERLSAALSSGENAENDFLNKWINGNIKSPIPKELLEIIIASKITNSNTSISKFGYVINWYVSDKVLEKMKRENYFLIGLDTSDALGGKGDDIGIVIRDSRSGAVIGAGNYNETNLAIFSDFLVELLETFPNSLLVPERRSSAVAMMDIMFRLMLVKNMNPYKRIFNWTVNNLGDIRGHNAISIVTKMPTLDELAKNKRQFGFATSSGGATSRGLLYGNVFRASLTYTASKTHDPVLISQLSGLKIVNNRIDHDADSHDDLVFAWLLGYYVLQYGKNTELYGLTSNQKLTNVIDNELMGKNKGVDTEKVKEQMILREDIEQVVKLLQATTNVTRGIRLINRIRFLEAKIDTNILTNLSVDELLNNIKLYKRIKRNGRPSNNTNITRAV